jgi:hypothetical protein
MTAKKPPAPAHFEINPYQSYPLNHPVPVHVIGLAPPQQLEAAKAGELAGERPVRVTSSPNAPFIWIGQSLLNIQAARLKRAQSEDKAERVAALKKKAAEVKRQQARPYRRKQRAA